MAEDAQAAYAESVANRITPRLRAAGFRGTAGNWSLTASSGDVAIVNLQKSRWNTANEVGFTVNLAVVPAPWFEWMKKQYRLTATAKPREYHGLWRDRLRPADGLSRDGQFWVVRDEPSAAACAEDVTTQLETAGIPRLLHLLDRKALTEAIKAGDFGYIKMSPLIPLAVMLSDEGSSPELEETLRHLESNLPGWAEWKLRDDFVSWVRNRSTVEGPSPRSPGGGQIV
jgi:hypothetical protein